MVFPQVGEAVGVWRGSGPRGKGGRGSSESNAERAGRRARTKVRRYCVANGLDRLASFTYNEEGEGRATSAAQVMADLADFMKRLRAVFGPQAEVHMPEPHKDGVHWHGHMAIGSYIPQKLLEELWGKGFVHIKRFKNVRTRDGRKVPPVQAVAGYVAKYVGKTFETGTGVEFGRHRYECAQGFQPEAVVVSANSLEGFQRRVSAEVGARVVVVWSSDKKEDWRGPPVVMLRWNLAESRKAAAEKASMAA